MVASVELLKAARAKIADPANWTTEVLAKDTKGEQVDFSHPSACQWCGLGALFAVDGLYTGSAADLYHAAQVLYKKSPASVNDQLGHSAVLAIYDYAIAKAEAEASNA